MQRAIELARIHRTHPNPRVGAVVVNADGLIVGEGSHAGPGTDHAEVGALAEANQKAKGSTLFVTLEPCNHHGRTPPCVDAIVAAEIGHVVVGTVDPDRRVSGAGISALMDAGLQVTIWDDSAEIEQIDPAYFFHRRTGLPLVKLKYAMTLDGSVAAADGSSRWITSDEARSDAHLLRSEADAVIVGAGTLRSDNPRLDVRIDGYKGPQPRPVVVAGRRELPSDSDIWSRNPLVFSTTRLTATHGENVVVPGGEFPEPREVAKALADRGFLDVMLEGGPTIISSWWDAGLITSGVVYVGSKIGGGPGVAPLAGVFENIDQAGVVTITDVQMVGPDVRISFQ